MTSFYLALALTIALTLNNRHKVVRATGTAIAAISLGFMAWSIILANSDGTFAAAPANSRTPLLLNIEAALLIAGAALLLWTVPRQLRQPTTPIPLRGTPTAYGQITRTLHWTSAVLIIAAFTMGQFIGILATDNPVRADFLATHIAIGGAIFLLTFARMIERLLKPAPPNPTNVHLAHCLLYALITATCVTGLAMVDTPVQLLGLSLPNLPADPIAAPLHQRTLPVLFLILIALHLYGAIRAIRRMAR
nr:cytochrome b/b6 domain-containing protein [Polymorphobacter sp.]